MPLGLPTQVKTMLARGTGNITAASLVKIEFETDQGGPRYWTDAGLPVTYSGDTYVPSQDFISINFPKEKLERDARQILIFRSQCGLADEVAEKRIKRRHCGSKERDIPRCSVERGDRLSASHLQRNNRHLCGDPRRGGFSCNGGADSKPVRKERFPTKGFHCRCVPKVARQNGYFHEFQSHAKAFRLAQIRKSRAHFHRCLLHKPSAYGSYFHICRNHG